ncbi:prolyl oligopeptidase family serine peptidase [Halorussus gelatinilyticus]|uniref:Prolyl oligopeptidase family serine peptidase n=1 Tax=Halorussus gelatinilyticus TaxID=2937524 RepID=A0A8U0ILT5_9EURY|nr:prolyl oligopeptidase family serine peptidase [Halorussus gelatinilyticus]UPW02100.1 prolyl oligopeptidase family serine peptidase [Halorussus gelatinilyticus]
MSGDADATAGESPSDDADESPLDAEKSPPDDADLEIADVLDVDYPSAPEWSADGAFLATLVYEDDGNALRIVAPGESAASSDAADSSDAGISGHVTGFAWAPETRPTEFVLTTDAGETYRGDAADRSLRLVARSPAGEAHHEWSPSGDRLAFYRDGAVCVRDADSGAERRLDLPGHETFLPSERMLAWDDAGERLAFSFTDRESRQVGVADAESGDLLWRTDAPASCANPAWLADGRVVFERVVASRTVRSVVAADPETGAETELVRDEDERGTVSSGAPTVSPDGTRLAVALPLDGWEHVFVLDCETGERRQLTAGEFEDKGLAGSSPRWVDGETLAFASNRRNLGERQLFAVDVETEAVRPLVESRGTNVHPDPSPAGDRLAYVHADADVSPEVRVQSLGSDEPPTRVTRSTVEDWPVSALAPEEVSFESADGREIRGYLFDPRETEAVEAEADEGEAETGDAADLPAVVWVHGGPMRQMRDGWHPSRSYGLAYAFHQYLARRGYVGLLVNYRGGIGYGREFRQSLTEGYGRDEMADVVAGAEFLRKREFTSGQVGVWGLSYGGYATLQILGTHPEAFDVGVNLAGLADLELYEEWATQTKFPAVESAQSLTFGGNPWAAADEWAAASPKTHFENYEAPLYNFHGTGDSYVNFEQLDAVIEGMLEHGNEYEAEYYPGENHVFAERATWERTLRKIESAFDEHLK